ncbi:uncharacterized protein LOC110461012 [Mizuhopecten yessoensis]|uniref:Uncharacterized protein n=1 Tax=Mizuhopecten yessoensis TaxID=6573 RepID=A0A210Q130_MIZYE|nr:uncharacterized protein LOC110461012 [Mizuhopecten yessoensis]OWF42464.1 hypothetical protein KP79_PYT22288 [Mizuhopecten yessoensis]
MSEESGDQGQSSSVPKNNNETINSDEKKIEENPPEDLTGQIPEDLTGQIPADVILKKCLGNNSGDQGESEGVDEDQVTGVESREKTSEKRQKAVEENCDSGVASESEGVDEDQVTGVESREKKSDKRQKAVEENCDSGVQGESEGVDEDQVTEVESREKKSEKRQKAVEENCNSGVQGESEGVDEDQVTGVESRDKKSEKRWQKAVEEYCQFLEYIWKNYRFGLIMHTSFTLALMLGWTVIWQPVQDRIYYHILNYPKPPELDPNQITDFMKQHKQNSQCDLTELQEKYTTLQESYSSLEEDMLTLQNTLHTNYTKLNETLAKHEKRISNTSSSLESIGSNVTDFEGKLQLQTKQTHRLQRDVDSNILKQISEEIWKYLSVIVAVGEIGLFLYVIKLKSLLGNRGRQPQALVQQTDTVDRQDTNRDGHDNQPRSVLNGAFKTSTDNSVCVLSFNGGSAHTKHVKLSWSFLDKKVKVTDVVIHGEGEIINIPPSKIVLVHVDFNARNIILENPEREIGELRRTTVQALWRMNADVILFYYYEERNAKPLGDQDLYSSDLVSVRTQTELKRLEGQKRFISLNGKLSERQKQHLRGVVQTRIG